MQAGAPETKFLSEPPLSSAVLHASRHEYTRTIEPARALAAETLTLERKLKAEGQKLNAESPPLPRPAPAGDCPDVANRPVTDAHPPGPQPAWNDMPAQDETV